MKFNIGDLVRIDVCNSRPEINGKVGKVVDIFHEAGCYTIMFPRMRGLHAGRNVSDKCNCWNVWPLEDKISLVEAKKQYKEKYLFGD